jgi:hypothetical protein
LPCQSVLLPPSILPVLPRGLQGAPGRSCKPKPSHDQMCERICTHTHGLSATPSCLLAISSAEDFDAQFQQRAGFDQPDSRPVAGSALDELARRARR